MKQNGGDKQMNRDPFGFDVKTWRSQGRRRELWEHRVVQHQVWLNIYHPSRWWKDAKLNVHLLYEQGIISTERWSLCFMVSFVRLVVRSCFSDWFKAWSEKQIKEVWYLLSPRSEQLMFESESESESEFELQLQSCWFSFFRTKLTVYVFKGLDAPDPIWGLYPNK